MPFARLPVRVPATSANLGPGFDCLGLAFQLYNYVSICEAESDLITVSGEGENTLSRDSSNIAFIAAKRLLQHLHALPDTPIHLHLENAIPLSRGLGSSSAARAGALVAANEWIKQNGHVGASNRELLNLATDLEGHPDNVAAALSGGLTVSAIHQTNQSTLDALATRFPVAVWPKFAVFIPDAHLETKIARGVLPPEVPRGDAIFNLSRTALLLSALANGDWTLLPSALEDRLHQAQRAPLLPGFEAITAAARQHGALGTTLSGAGPTMLIWLHPEHDTSKVLWALQNAAESKNVPGRALELKVDLDGCVPATDD